MKYLLVSALVSLAVSVALAMMSWRMPERVRSKVLTVVALQFVALTIAIELWVSGRQSDAATVMLVLAVFAVIEIAPTAISEAALPMRTHAEKNVSAVCGEDATPGVAHPGDGGSWLEIDAHLLTSRLRATLVALPYAAIVASAGYFVVWRSNLLEVAPWFPWVLVGAGVLAAAAPVWILVEGATGRHRFHMGVAGLDYEHWVAGVRIRATTLSRAEAVTATVMRLASEGPVDSGSAAPFNHTARQGSHRREGQDRCSWYFLRLTPGGCTTRSRTPGIRRVTQE